MSFVRRPVAAALIALTLAGCTLGPDYQRPALPQAEAFKEVEGWKLADAEQSPALGQWWTLYRDPVLSDLVARIEPANQTLAAAEARYRQAQALVQSARAQLFPLATGGVGATRSGQAGSSVGEAYQASISASWELDLWGRLRRTVEANRANAQASAADLAAVRLSLQAELVETYLQLRILDEQRRLLDATVEAYARSLRLTENQYRAGIAPKSDVTQAQAQLKSAQAQAIDLAWQRAQFEHALAVLVGVPPADFELAIRDGALTLPIVPVGVPSQLLERRPDIATAERQVMAANALIGVAEAAWYPDLVLSADAGYQGSSWGDLFSVPNRFWSLGPQLALTLLDFGSRRAERERVEASYDETVAVYRQTVLDAFREVEDYLVQLRVLQEEAVVQQDALEAAQESLRLIQNQYRAGIVDYLSVATLQTSALNAERTQLLLLGDQLVASVRLIAALGGGWHSDTLGAAQESADGAE